MLFLNKKDMLKAIALESVMDKVEDAYRIFAGGKFNMPERPVVQDGENTVLFMPCFMENYFSTKVLTLFPKNPGAGLPLIQGLMLLNDAENGETLAILDGSFLTSLRTGAVGGVAMRCFSPENAASVGIIGAGTQGFYQALYACAARPIKEIYLFDTGKKDWSAYVDSLRTELGKNPPEIHIKSEVEELITSSDIVVTATTSSVPVMPDDPGLLKGKCFVAIGSYKPDVREMPDAIWKLVDHVYTELPFAVEESGDLSQPLADGLLDIKQVRYIGDLLTKTPRPTAPPTEKTTFFKSVGMGLLDLNVAQLIYERALKMGLGQTVDL